MSAPWSTALVPDRCSLLHAGRGDGWWWSEAGPRIDDGERRWVWTPEGIRVHPVPAPPAGAMWSDRGTLYARTRRGVRPVDVVRGTERWIEGPEGAVLVGSDTLTRGAAPGRTPQPLPTPLLAAPLRFSPAGLRVAGLTPDERGVVIDLQTRTVVATPPGVPAGWDVWMWPDGTVRRGDRVLVVGGREGSCAVHGDRLAGPGGRIWSLTTGTPVADEAVIALGATTATPVGFATVDWRTHAGCHVDPAGRRSRAFRLPLSDDDTVLAGAWRDGALWWQSAEGRTFRVDGERVHEVASVEPLPAPREQWVPSPAGALRATGEVVVGAHRFVFHDDGWLWALPADHSSAASPDGSASSTSGTS